jgi:selenocysteine-specific elongation factor
MIVGTAGHIDHGKTSLVKALTGVDADRLKEEKERGITIDLGFAYWPQADGSVIGFVDVPGHERFVHTMLAGAQTVDVVLLVVAADDGVMPQTREHVEILALLGLRRAVVALTKADMVDAARLAAARAEVEAVLAGTPLAGAAILPVSSVTGAGIADLAAHLQAVQRDLAARATDRLFRLAVDRCFVLQGAGVVVTGMVLDGAVDQGDEVVVAPSGLAARVRSLHAQNRKASRGVAGDRCALNLAGPQIARDAVARGDVVTHPQGCVPSRRIDVEVHVASGASRGLTAWMPVRLHVGTAEVGGRLVLLGEGVPAPGDTAFVQVVLDRPVAARVHDRFILRDVSASRTLAGGRILDLRAPDRRRRTPERLALLAALAATADRETLRVLLERGDGALDLDAFAADRGLPRDTCDAWAQDEGATVMTVGPGRVAVGAPRIARLRAAIRERLDLYHAQFPDQPGLGREKLRVQVAPRLAAPVFRETLRQFSGEGMLGLEGAWVRLDSHRIELAPEDEALWHEVRPLVSGAERFRPPRVRDLAGMLGREEATVRRVMHRVARTGEIHEAAQDHFFLRAALQELVSLAGAAQEEGAGWFNAARFRDKVEAACGGTVGRKVAIQILEFLDRHGVTSRRADVRRLNPHRAGLFDASAAEAMDRGGALCDIPSEQGREASPVGRPDFKSGWGRQTVSGGFDSHSLPPPIPGGGRRD